MRPLGVVGGALDGGAVQVDRAVALGIRSRVCLGMLLVLVERQRSAREHGVKLVPAPGRGLLRGRLPDVLLDEGSFVAFSWPVI